MSETIHLDQLVDPFEAKVVVVRDDAGAIVDARFDLAGLPRLDPMLAGKDVAGVPDLVKMLCGICPVAHHLAGVAALESLAGTTPDDLPRPVRDQRLLLHHGSVLDSLASRFIGRDRELAVRLRRLGKLAMKAAGAPGHFPGVAIPGGVRVPVDAEALADLAGQLPPLDDDLAHLLGHLPQSAARTSFAGLDVAVVDADGRLDPLGGHVGVLGPGPIHQTFTAAEWASRVTESRPGAPDPRPVIEVGGKTWLYRVGPMARARFRDGGAAVSDPFRAQLLTLADSVSALMGLAESLAGVRNASAAVGETASSSSKRAGTGIGVVDGPRGLLAHEYAVDEAGTVAGCRILTPTAQNEAWLAGMLRESLAAVGDDNAEAWAESAIRAADPCLPCTSAPEGGMGVKLEDERDELKEGGR
ncbi:reducing hydrogenase subunit alpha [Corynebacterium sp. NPDC060344]|uniref:reducing hydrogenase subunit alpha n=1 Tax=Corynebacterium sp. NPDC060344 TaxID=3347101 RepID=UPI003649D7C5